ncbi:AraC family transcriptional regulator [Isoptericola sp. BMS4]|uniref:helix-turn-helix domain-containing protein n=1 Tax=Isoptericola sp. BMS4 TaxID=2527875 RepID=UPI00141F8D48|nr:helix-turn-helix domain-containing protein [Isoptericola sp. BMS4]
MDYAGRVPAPPLDRYIDDIYCLSGVPRHRRLNVPPMPSAHLFVNLAGPVAVHDPGGAGPPAVFSDGWFMGLCTRRVVIEYPPVVRLVGAHFTPWGLSSFVGLPASALTDRWVPVDALWGGALDGIRDRLDGTTSSGALRVLEDELRSRLRPGRPGGLELVHRTAGVLAASWGGISVAALAGGAGVSGNHLAARFKDHVGVTPKRMARIYRFARLILSVDTRRDVGLAELAHAVGYVDQSHLSNEFKAFTGLTPTAYLELRRRFPAERGFPPDQGPMPAE